MYLVQPLGGHAVRYANIERIYPNVKIVSPPLTASTNQWKRTPVVDPADVES
jgi:hypothetical protein